MNNYKDEEVGNNNKSFSMMANRKDENTEEALKVISEAGLFYACIRKQEEQ